MRVIDNFLHFRPRLEAWKAHSHLNAPGRSDFSKRLRLAAIRVNRLLAWAMVAVPAVGLLVGWSWQDSLPWIIGLIAAHGVLSLALFGGPRVKEHGWPAFRIRVLGHAPSEASPRERFMIGSWAIVLCIAWPVAGVWVLVSDAVLAGVWVLALTVLWPATMVFMLRYPFAVGSHVARATEYALKRWGYGQLADGGAGTVLAWLYIALQFAHLFHAA
jgi:hypothetical protein